MHIATIKKIGLFVAAVFVLLIWARPAVGQEGMAMSENRGGQRVFVADVAGPIGPATRDFIIQSIEDAADRDGALLVQAATSTARIISGSILVNGAGSP